MADEARSVCLTFDFDGMSLWLGSFATENVSAISRGEFGVVGAKRLLALAEKYEVPFTFCVPGHTALCYPDLIKRIHDEGHEIVHHGWVHENPVKQSREQEKANLDRTFDILDKVCGVRPEGYRSPAWDFSVNTVELLLEAGFLWESSCMANDFYPYYLRKGDVASATEPYVFGKPVDLIEIPVTWGLDDFPPFEFYWPAGGAHNTGLMSPWDVRDIWQGDFDYMAENCPGGVFNITMHPQVIGRGHRQNMLESLVSHMKGTANVKFERLSEYVKRWKAANPLDKWVEENPELAGTAAYVEEKV